MDRFITQQAFSIDFQNMFFFFFFGNYQFSEKKPNNDEKLVTDAIWDTHLQYFDTLLIGADFSIVIVATDFTWIRF